MSDLLKCVRSVGRGRHQKRDAAGCRRVRRAGFAGTAAYAAACPFGRSACRRSSQPSTAPFGRCRCSICHTLPLRGAYGAGFVRSTSHNWHCQKGGHWKRQRGFARYRFLAEVAHDVGQRMSPSATTPMIRPKRPCCMCCAAAVCRDCAACNRWLIGRSIWSPAIGRFYNCCDHCSALPERPSTRIAVTMP